MSNENRKKSGFQNLINRFPHSTVTPTKPKRSTGKQPTINIDNSPGTFVAGRDITIGGFTHNFGVPPEKHNEEIVKKEIALERKNNEIKGLKEQLDRAFCPSCNAEMPRIGTGKFAWQCRSCGVFNEDGKRTNFP